jgi:hypothetical protein
MVAFDGRRDSARSKIHKPSSASRSLAERVLGDGYAQDIDHQAREENTDIADGETGNILPTRVEIVAAAVWLIFIPSSSSLVLLLPHLLCLYP